jgi:hypothetical protein
MKITGLDAIMKKTEQMSKFASEIDGELASVSFDPSDPASIEAALLQVSDAIDEKTKSYDRNDWVQNLAAELKEQTRNTILEKAAAARIGK